VTVEGGVTVLGEVGELAAGLDLDRADANRALGRQQLDQLHVAHADRPAADEEAKVDLIDARWQARRHLDAGVAAEGESVRRQRLP
jgi:hypothetical protein